MGAGARFPYPKEVYSPSGGWWTRPKNWKMNTFIAGMGALVVTYAIFKVSADKEWRYMQPDRPILSMLWARQYTVPGAKPPSIFDRLKGSPYENRAAIGPLVTDPEQIKAAVHARTQAIVEAAEKGDKPSS